MKSLVLKLAPAIWVGLTVAGWHPAVAAPIISEILTSNATGSVDEDGTAADWLEIYNPDSAAVNLLGWHLTDTATKPAKWTFPSVVVEPGGFLRVWASGKDRTSDPAQLHTNFSLSSSGEYLALVTPDGASRPSEFSPSYPALETDESYGVLFSRSTLLDQSAPALTLVPADGALGLGWLEPGFTPGPGWINGPTNIGFGMLAPGFLIEERLSTTAVTTITIAEAVLSGTNAADRLTDVVEVVNFTSDGGLDGRIGDGVPFLHGGDQSNYALRATGTLVIPSDGQWTFHVNSDDGFRLRIDNTIVMTVTGVRAPADSLITRTLTAGNHALVLTYFENTGGDEVELSAAQGTQTSFSSLFKLIGDTKNGGLAVLAPAGSGLATVATDIGAAMLNVNASAYVRVPFTVADPTAVDTLDLSLGYNDGFVAYLNGTEVARRNAPSVPAFDAAATAGRSILESLKPDSLNVSAFRPLLVVGTNTLAVHGLNASAGDSTFFVAPRLFGGRREVGQQRFFRQPTPGGPNTTAGVLGHVADTTFTPGRGLFTAPQTVSLTSATPGATIRYTINGSTPTLTNGATYTAPLGVDRTTVIRAAAFLDGYEATNVDTHTYLFLSDVILQGTVPTNGAKPGPDWPNPGSVGSQVINYGMDKTIVNNTNPLLGGPAQTIAALQALPSVCVTTDLPNLFHTTTGIYTHASSHGETWERPASVEMLGDARTPEGGFHSPCGVRIRGGYSRDPSNPKHAFRLFFRTDYGPGKLTYPIFGDEGTSEFDAFDIQCSQNYSWSYGGDSTHNALREIWSRDTQHAVGQPYTRGRFVHLYLNGVYWGLYQIQERSEAAFGATYLGGDKDDYDVIKHTGNNAGPNGTYTTEATDGYFVSQPDGSQSAWKKLWDASRACYFINKDRNPAAPTTSLVSTPQEKVAAYYKLMGLQADGRTPTGEPVLLDVDNLIDYIIILFFTKNTDSGISAFLSNAQPNNFFCLRNRAGTRGFVSMLHDAEHSLDAGSAADRWGPWQTDTSTYWNGINYSNPQYFHQDLTASGEYRMRFADHLQHHFFNNGPMTVAQNQARLDLRATQVEPAIIAESARWGDSKITPARTAANWRTARTNTRNWFTNRSTQFVSEARTRGFYPALNPPTFNQRGGSVPPGFNLVLTNPNPAGGTIFYTTDGSDPRPVGGGSVPTILIPEFTGASYLVPSDANGGSTLSVAQWTGVTAPPNLPNWSDGPLGFGFNPAGRPATTNFTPFIKTDVQSAMQPVGGTASGTLYIRLPFTLTAEKLDTIDNLRLRVRYDDAFIAYLNGHEVARKVVAAGFVPAWNSVSTSSHADASAVIAEDIPVPAFRSLLVPGENVLAFHVMNQAATNSDLLFSPQVEIDTSFGVTAPAYAGPIGLYAPTTVLTRVLNGIEWSPLEEAGFFINTAPASAANLVVSEFSYNPLGAQNAAEAAYVSNDFEFIEIENISSMGVDLTGVQLTSAVAYSFTGTPSQLTLPPGGRRLLVGNLDAFHARFGSMPGQVVGVFTGSLDNSGETVRLLTGGGAIIKEFTYSQNDPWPKAADGDGYSLVLLNPAANPDHANPANWRSSAARNGNPLAAKGTTYDAWKTVNGVALDSEDADGDGMSAFMEYALGTSLTHNSLTALPAAGVGTFVVGPTSAEYLTLTFDRNLAADDVVYSFESTSSLSGGQWLPEAAVLVSESNNGDGTATMVHRSAEPVTAGQKLFLRLKMSLR